MSRIRFIGDPVLREKAHEIPLAEIQSSEIQTIIQDMRATLEGQKNGIALAAPQIGILKRIIVISHRAFESDNDQTSRHAEDLVVINPVIKKMSQRKKWLEEGCLSIPNVFGEVHRSIKTTIEAYDTNGKKFMRGDSGLIAQIFQHEIDHLDGILFIDKARNIQELEPTHDTE